MKALATWFLREAGLRIALVPVLMFAPGLMATISRSLDKPPRSVLWYWVRWVFMLPAGAAASTMTVFYFASLSWFALGRLLRYDVLRLPWFALTCAAAAFAFIYVGAKMAPQGKAASALALLIVLTVFLAFGLVMVAAGRDVTGLPGWFWLACTILELIAAALATYVVLNEERDARSSLRG